MPSSRYYRFKITDKEDRIKKIKIWTLWFFILIIFLFFIWLIFLSSLFKIRNINISDNNYINQDDIEKIISKIMPFGIGKNLLILPKQKLKDELEADFLTITDITIKKEFFHTLSIDFQKRIPLGIWCQLSIDQTGNCYYFDKDGIIFSDAPQTEGSLILKIEDGSKNNVSIGDKILNSGQISFITAFSDKINKSGSIKIMEFKIKPDFSIDLEAITDKNWPVYLDESQDPIMSANNLLMVLKEAVKNANNLEYVDLRVSGQIYYK